MCSLICSSLSTSVKPSVQMRGGLQRVGAGGGVLLPLANAQCLREDVALGAALPLPVRGCLAG